MFSCLTPHFHHSANTWGSRGGAQAFPASARPASSTFDAVGRRRSPRSTGQSPGHIVSCESCLHTKPPSPRVLLSACPDTPAIACASVYPVEKPPYLLGPLLTSPSRCFGFNPLSTPLALPRLSPSSLTSAVPSSLVYFLAVPDTTRSFCLGGFALAGPPPPGPLFPAGIHTLTAPPPPGPPPRPHHLFKMTSVPLLRMSVSSFLFFLSWIPHSSERLVHEKPGTWGAQPLPLFHP